MAASQQALLMSGAATDSYFGLVQALLHFNGADGGTTFTDSSTYTRTVTRNGSVTTSTVNPKWGTAAGLFAGGRLEVSLSVATDQDFCIESWVRPTGTGTTQAVWSWGRAGSYYVLRTSGGGLCGFSYSWASSAATSGNVYAADTYHHVALSRSGNVIRFFVDGTQVGVNSTLNNASFSSAIYIGNETGVANPFAGEQDDFRITLDAARYTANFTPPSAPFPDS